MIRYLCLAMASLLAAATPAAAVTITYSGTGTVSAVRGTLAPTGAAPLGSEVNFSFDFDTDAAKFYGIEDGAAYYDLPLSAFSATIGTYAFELSQDPLFVPTVELYRAFTFLGGTSSSRVLTQSIYLAGRIKPLGSNASPFPIAAGTYDTIMLSATFLAGDDDTALGFDQFVDPSRAISRSFGYNYTDRAAAKSGRLSGSFAGGFATAAAVPEPATWLMTLLGFALLGGALRSTPRRRALLPA